MPCSRALCTAGRMAVPSWARMIRASAPSAMRLLDVGELLLRRRPGVGRDVLGPGLLERRLDGRLVGVGPSRLVEVVPRHADGDAFAAAAGPLGAGAFGAACGIGGVVIASTRCEHHGQHGQQYPESTSEHVSSLTSATRCARATTVATTTPVSPAVMRPRSGNCPRRRPPPRGGSPDRPSSELTDRMLAAATNGRTKRLVGRTQPASSPQPAHVARGPGGMIDLPNKPDFPVHHEHGQQDQRRKAAHPRRGRGRAPHATTSAPSWSASTCPARNHDPTWSPPPGSTGRRSATWSGSSPTSAWSRRRPTRPPPGPAVLRRWCRPAPKAPRSSPSSWRSTRWRWPPSVSAATSTTGCASNVPAVTDPRTRPCSTCPGWPSRCSTPSRPGRPWPGSGSPWWGSPVAPTGSSISPPTSGGGTSRSASCSPGSWRSASR